MNLQRTRRYTFGSLARDRRGAIAVVFAVMLVPFIIGVGVAVDYARMLQYQTRLQDVVDAAALAGAAVFDQQTDAADAKQVATNYFYSEFAGNMPPGGTLVGTPTVTSSATGTINPALGTSTAYTVQVSAKTTIAPTFLSILNLQVLNVSATGTAGNPTFKINLSFSNLRSSACDGNTAYVYLVPKNAQHEWDYSSVPSFSVASTTGGNTTQGNYYEIGNNYGQALPAGQIVPTVTATQPLGIMLQNVTNANNCGGVTGANSYGAPGGGVQTMYSSLLANGAPNGEAPTDNTNYNYTLKLTYQNTQFKTITAATVTLPASTAHPSGATITQTIPTGSNASYDTITQFIGNASCGTASTSGSTRTYSCRTQYRTSSSSSSPNCNLYIQTGVTNSYVSGLSDTSAPPSAASGGCFATNAGSGYPLAAPTCAQISDLANGTGSSATASSAVFWWNDSGGEAPGEQSYGTPKTRCTTSGAGDGDDCDYNDAFFAINCTGTGGAGSGGTEVLLTQ